jgi:hypothetical protein
MRLDEHKIYLLGEFAEDYLERRMSRRDLLRRALLVTGSVPLAATSFWRWAAATPAPNLSQRLRRRPRPPRLRRRRRRLRPALPRTTPPLSRRP